MGHHVLGQVTAPAQRLAAPDQVCVGFGDQGRMWWKQDTRRKQRKTLMQPRPRGRREAPASRNRLEDRVSLLALQLHIFCYDDMLPLKSFLKHLFKIIYPLINAKY